MEAYTSETDVKNASAVVMVCADKGNAGKKAIRSTAKRQRTMDFFILLVKQKADIPSIVFKASAPHLADSTTLEGARISPVKGARPLSRKKTARSQSLRICGA